MEEDSKLNESESSKEKKSTGKLKKIKSDFFERFNTAENARIRRNVSLFMEKYSKPAAYGSVVALMLIVCVVSLVNRKMSGTGDLGVVMSMSETAAESKSFAGKSFDAEILTYDDMLTLEAENQNQAGNEATMQRINAILATVSTDKSNSATLSERKEDETSSVYQLPEVTSVATVVIDSETGEVVSTGSGPQVAEPVYATADGEYQYMGEFILTGYCPCPICCGAWSNMDNPITASGSSAVANHTVAVDTSVIPFGTEILINGQVYVAEDRGSAIIGNHIDIFFATHEEAKSWGKQTGSVYVKIATEG
jgi:3D (Asp-Asp-Asp) domain-containing protein